MQRDYIDFYMRSGIALEHLLKSRLAAISPTLIADPRNFSSMLLLAQLSDDQLPVPMIKTIGVVDSLQRCQSLVASLGAFADRLKILIGYRNGAAHAAIVNEAEASKDLAAFVGAIDLLVRDLQQPRESFYGDFIQFVNVRLDQSRDEAEVEAKAAIAAAAAEFRRRYPGTAPGWALGEALHGWQLEQKCEIQRFNCPACPSDAMLYGDSDLEWEAETDEEGNVCGVSPIVHFLPSQLECRACGLRLRGRQLPAIGVPDSLILRDVDPSDFVELDDE
ncbi:hypothetical protein [Micromonospora pallida]|uniref:hypothetical protein n=1 Tax=Micromonospora pallida TaxID=145854 RepID=UPI00114CDCE7|nr:hypothetical protein [Micromonospora pallida]